MSKKIVKAEKEVTWVSDKNRHPDRYIKQLSKKEKEIKLQREMNATLNDKRDIF